MPTNPTRLTPAREAEIRARLAARTPGEWQAGRDDMQSYHAGTGEAYTAIYADNPEGRFHLGHRLPFVVARAYDESGRNKEDARFIANAPTDMAVLLAEVEALRARYETPGQRCNRGHDNILPVSLWCCPMCTDALRADAERLDWYASHAGFVVKYTAPDGTVTWQIGNVRYPSLRAAIDAARATEAPTTEEGGEHGAA